MNDEHDEEVPPRVLAAEERRRFRDLLSASSLGCPFRQCEHSLGWHFDETDEVDRRGMPRNPRCRHCDCGHETTTEGRR